MGKVLIRIKQNSGFFAGKLEKTVSKKKRVILDRFLKTYPSLFYLTWIDLYNKLYFSIKTM